MLSLFELRIALELLEFSRFGRKKTVENSAQKATRVVPFSECLMLLKISNLIGFRFDL